MLWCCCCADSHWPGGDEERQALTGLHAEELRVFAAMWIRSSAERFRLERLLPQVGARKGKSFVWLVEGAAADQMFGWIFSRSHRAVLAVSNCDRAIGAHERPFIERALRVAHPVLMPIELADVSRPDRAAIVRDWVAGGSLRDVIHGSPPEKSYNDKYDGIGTPLSEAKIAAFGRALLDALLVLRPLGPHVATHIHLGNLFPAQTATHALATGDPLIRIAEWEQGLLAMPSPLEHFFHDLGRILEPFAIAFALCVYEMATGFELDGLPIVIPPSCPRLVRQALEELMVDHRGKKSARRCTLEDARALPLFSRTSPGPAWPPLPDGVLQAASEVRRRRG